MPFDCATQKAGSLKGIPAKKAVLDFVDCEFWVRPGVSKAYFQIPYNMKRSEAERFAEAIRCFWFEDDI